MRKSVSCALFVLFLAFTLTPKLHGQNLCRRVAGGTLAGQPVDSINDTIAVPPGSVVTGTVQLQTVNTMGPGAIAPLGATVNWGNRTTAHWTINAWIAPLTNTYAASVNVTVPTTPGTYYLILGFSGVYNLAQLMSGTHPGISNPVWNDGNDAGFDWTATQFGTALANGGSVSVNTLLSNGTYTSGPQAFTAVKIVVGGCTSVFSLDITSSANSISMRICGTPATAGLAYITLHAWGPNTSTTSSVNFYGLWLTPVELLSHVLNSSSPFVSGMLDSSGGAFVSANGSTTGLAGFSLRAVCVAINPANSAVVANSPIDFNVF